MELPLELIADAAQEGNIYFFEDDCPVGVKGHMHVCLKVGERVLLFSTCTSQTNTVLNYVKFLGYDANTFPCFRQDEVNKFRRELTYVNCNNVTNLSKEEFAALVKDGKIRSLGGELTEVQIGQVVNGVKLSTRVTDEVKALLR